MRACADLAGQARARRDQSAAADAADAADSLAAWVGRMGRVPFTDHPTVATIMAERATWDAERTRVAGPGDPGAWDGAAKAWQDLSWPHRAGYAWWRQAEAQLARIPLHPAAASEPEAPPRPSRSPARPKGARRRSKRAPPPLYGGRPMCRPGP
jgi:hypothetical protein